MCLARCPLLGVKRTLGEGTPMSAFLTRGRARHFGAARSADCRSVSERRALQIGADYQWTRICRLEFGDGGIEIKQSDVTDDQSPDMRLLRDTSHDRWRCVKRTCGAGGNCEVHD
jgi:hypothetical protein